MTDIQGMAAEAARREGLLDFVYLHGREREFRTRRHAREHLLQKWIGVRGKKHADFYAAKRKQIVHSRRQSDGSAMMIGEVP